MPCREAMLVNTNMYITRLNNLAVDMLSEDSIGDFVLYQLSNPSIKTR